MRIELEEARDLLLAQAQVVPIHKEELLPALGLIMAQDAIASADIPDTNRSAFDGYAVDAADLIHAGKFCPVSLKIVQHLDAASCAATPLQRGQCCKVTTGAALPPAAESVVKFEDVVLQEDGTAVFHRAVARGANVIVAGENLQAGELAVAAGTPITPAAIGVLASMGVGEVAAHRQVRVAIISTGKELRDVGQPLTAGSTYNSTGYALAAWCRHLGINAQISPQLPETKAEIIAALNEASAQADLILTTGGVSAGDDDFIKAALLEWGAELLFHNLNIKPGSPTLGAVKDGKLIVGLSGNPAAALVPFNLLVQPVIGKISGLADFELPIIEVVLREGFPKGGGTRRFLRAQLEIENGTAYARLTGAQSNGVLASFIGCDLLLDIAGGMKKVEGGKVYKAFYIR